MNLENKRVEHFKANKIYFLRIVRRKNDKDSDNEYGFIDILKHEIKLPKDLIISRNSVASSLYPVPSRT
ncbi:MAG: hypothetical protein N2V75_08215 [Methanophagales archaeon]|nr:hypothetical protein [Methanophagales archaeon]